MTMVISPPQLWNTSSISTVTWSDSKSHTCTLANAVSHLHTGQSSDHPDTDLILICEGRSIHVHRLVVAAASPFLSKLVSEAEAASPLCLVGLSYSQAMMVVHFIYHGMLERVSELEIERLLEATKHLQISGLNSGKTVLIKTQVDSDNMEDDDVFTDADQPVDNNHAVDLSPVNR